MQVAGEDAMLVQAQEFGPRAVTMPEATEPVAVEPQAVSMPELVAARQRAVPMPEVVPRQE